MKQVLLLLIVSLFLAGCQLPGSSSRPPTEKEIVRNIFGGLIETNHNSQGQVTEINCPNMRLSNGAHTCEIEERYLPQIGQLKELRVLSIQKSTLTTLPSEIGNLTKLESLFVRGDFTTIPAEIGQLNSLESLYLTGKFTTIPAEIGQLANLKQLYLGGDFMTFPPEIAQLTNLKPCF